LHAVMQPVALGKFIDVYVYFARDLQKKRAEKAEEIRSFTANTKTLLDKLDLSGMSTGIGGGGGGEQVEEKSRESHGSSIHSAPHAEKSEEGGIELGILSNHRVSIQMENVAIVAPLVKGWESGGASGERADSSSDREKATHPALLITARTMDFLSHRSEKASGAILDLRAQFVPAFTHKDPRHFSPTYHLSFNSVLFPSLACRVRSSREIMEDREPIRRLWVEGLVHGMEMDWSSDLVLYVNTLDAIWQYGKDRVAHLTEEMASGSGEVDRPSPEPSSLKGRVAQLKHNLSRNPDHSSRPAPMSSSGNDHSISREPSGGIASSRTWLDLEASFKVQSGTVRLHVRGASSHSKDTSDSGRGGLVLKIPGLTSAASVMVALGEEHPKKENIDDKKELGEEVVLDGMATPKEMCVQDKQRAHIEIMIHETDNRLNPMLLSFLDDILRDLRLTFLKSTSPSPTPFASPVPPERSLSSPIPLAHTLTSKAPSPTLHPPASASKAPISPSPGIDATTSPLSRLRFTILIQLSKTVVALECEGSSRVKCEAICSSATLLLSTSPSTPRFGEHTMSATGKVDGLSLRIHHTFSTDDALALSLDSVHFSLSMLPSTLSSSYPVLSIVVRLPYVEGRLSMRHFTHFVIFQHTWLDRAARTTSRIPQVIPMDEEKTDSSAPMVLPIHLVAQMGKGALKVDFGQQLGKLDLALTSMHGSIAQEMGEGVSENRMKTECLGKVEDLSGDFTGRMSGHLNLGPLSGHIVVWDGEEVLEENALKKSSTTKGRHESGSTEDDIKESYGRLRGTIMLDNLSAALIYEYQSLLMLRVSKTYIAALRGNMAAAEMVTPGASTWSSGFSTREKEDVKTSERVRNWMRTTEEESTNAGIDHSVLGLFIRVQSTDPEAILSTRTLPILLMLVGRTKRLVEGKIQAAYLSPSSARDSSTGPTASGASPTSPSPGPENHKPLWSGSSWLS
ncbi:hypothetical protein BJ684DRAFT_17754, partial [Piptocephalis cylindrospora]